MSGNSNVVFFFFQVMLSQVNIAVHKSIRQLSEQMKNVPHAGIKSYHRLFAGNKILL